MHRIAFAVSAAALLTLGACALPARPLTAATSGGRVYEEAGLGSRLASTNADDERIGKNPEASFTQPSFGIGSPGYIKPGGAR